MIHSKVSQLNTKQEINIFTKLAVTYLQFNQLPSGVRSPKNLGAQYFFFCVICKWSPSICNLISVWPEEFLLKSHIRSINRPEIQFYRTFKPNYVTLKTTSRPSCSVQVRQKLSLLDSIQNAHRKTNPAWAPNEVVKWWRKNLGH